MIRLRVAQGVDADTHAAAVWSMTAHAATLSSVTSDVLDAVDFAVDELVVAYGAARPQWSFWWDGRGFGLHAAGARAPEPEALPLTAAIGPLTTQGRNLSWQVGGPVSTFEFEPSSATRGSDIVACVPATVDHAAAARGLVLATLRSVGVGEHGPNAVLAATSELFDALVRSARPGTRTVDVAVSCPRPGCAGEIELSTRRAAAQHIDTDTLEQSAAIATALVDDVVWSTGDRRVRVSIPI